MDAVTGVQTPALLLSDRDQLESGISRRVPVEYNEEILRGYVCFVFRLVHSLSGLFCPDWPTTAQAEAGGRV